MAKAKTIKAKPSKATKSTKAKAATNGVAAASAGIVIPVDDLCPLKARGKVVDDWDAMLNQTNIGANNNKYYVIQLVEAGGKYHTWTRWGRVGEPGQNALLGNGTRADAEQCCKAKLKDKSSNNWEDRKNFVAKAGKYTLIEIERSAA